MSSAFVHPSWIEGMLYYGVWVIIPLIIAIISGVIVWWKDSGIALGVCMVATVMALLIAPAGAFVGWHFQYEVPSVQQEVITVDDWQPTFNHYWGDVKGADDLMLKTVDGQLFGNTESFLFGKFDTRDILDKLKPNGTYRITYYGWREGFNNGVPNILSVDEVINETNTPKHHDISNYMNKRSIVYNDDDWGNTH